MVAALLSVDRVSGDGRNETVSLIMTVFPTGGPGGWWARVTAPASQTGVSGVWPVLAGSGPGSGDWRWPGGIR